MMHDPTHERLMRRALRLARRGQGRVEPNPMVGAVIVRGGHIIGEGYHRAFGGPHAEVNALVDVRQRGQDPAGATMFVTLEPCRHHGKTPPCANALIEAGIAEVHVAMVDPFEQVAGGGLARLHQAGVRTHVGLCEPEARQLNEPFIKRVVTGLPWVIAKWAQTLDGRIAAASGDSQWISSPASRALVHRLRGRVDAVMVGIGTALADNPQLTARQGRLHRLARRVVIDPRLRLPLEAQLVRGVQGIAGAGQGKAHQGRPLTVAIRADLVAQDDERQARRQVMERAGVEIVELPPMAEPAGPLDLRPLLAHLAKAHHATNVLVEGGGTLTGSLLEQGLVDQVLAFVAPKVLGDAAAIPAAQGRSVEHIAHAWPLTLRHVRRLGDDVLLDYRVQQEQRGEEETRRRGDKEKRN